MNPFYPLQNLCPYDITVYEQISSGDISAKGKPVEVQGNILEAAIVQTVTALSTCAIVAVISARSIVRPTTLSSAWRWAVVVAFLWLTVWLADRGYRQVSWVRSPGKSLSDQFWYALLVCSLCPPVAVLGAKRPGSGAWTGFVIVPLLCVLGWPVVTMWFGQGTPSPLQIEPPLLIGCGLVILMGCGNYMGTRMTLPALLYAVALGCLTASFADAHEIGQPSTPYDDRLRTLATVMAGLSAIFGGWLLFRSRHAEPGWERVWRDYRDQFGIAWAKRCQERINQSAERESWAARLDFQGFVWNDNVTPEQRDYTVGRIDHTFRWLFRRFVDPVWIDQRLPSAEEESV